MWLVPDDQLLQEEYFEYLLQGAVRPFPKRSFNIQPKLSFIQHIGQIVCPFLSFESWGVNNMEILSKTWKTSMIYNIANLNIFRNASVVQQHSHQTTKGYFWSRSAFKNIERSNIFIGMFLNSYSWIDITIWKRTIAKKNFSASELINFTLLTEAEPMVIRRQYNMILSKIYPTGTNKTNKTKYSFNITFKGINFFEQFQHEFHTNIDDRSQKNYVVYLPFVVGELNFDLHHTVLGYSLKLDFVPINDTGFLAHLENYTSPYYSKVTAMLP